MLTATAAKPSPDYRTLSPEEILSAHEAGVPVPELLRNMCRGESVARRDGRWYLTTTAALAANLWEHKDGCEMIERPAEVAACEAILHWLAEQEFDHMCPPDPAGNTTWRPRSGGPSNPDPLVPGPVAAVLRASRALDAGLADWTPPAGVLALRPTVYAEPAWERYVRTAARSGCALLVGMNPGPHGMMQTGVPFCDPQTLALLFGEAEAGRLMLGKAKPEIEPGSWCVNRTTAGRREESARRLWNALREVADPTGVVSGHVARATQAVPLTFFAINAFPIGLLDAAKGTNVAPSDLKLEREVETAVLNWIADLAGILRPACVVSVGGWARDRVITSKYNFCHDAPLLHITHPSPRVGSEAAWRAEALPVLRRAHELVQEARR